MLEKVREAHKKYWIERKKTEEEEKTAVKMEMKEQTGTTRR